MTGEQPAPTSVAPQADTPATPRAMGGNEWLWLLARVHATDPGLVARGLAALAEDRRARA